MMRAAATALAAAALWAAFLMPAAAQQACFGDREQARQAAEQHGETLRFAGINGVGHLLLVYAGPASFTIFVQAPGAPACAFPILIGSVVEIEREARSDVPRP